MKIINIKLLYTNKLYIIYIKTLVAFRLFIKKKRKYEHVYINSLSFDIYCENGK